MARAAAACGTRVMVATPHMKDVNELSSPQAAASLCGELAGKLETAGCPLRLVMGMENHLVPDLALMFGDGRALPIEGTGYALIEMPFFGRPDHLEPTLEEIRSMGITPVLAHPERIEAVQRDPGLLAAFIEAGMLSQVTAGSLVGHFGDAVRRFTEELIRGEMAHVMSSDCHRPDGPRSPDLGPGLAAAEALIGSRAAGRLVCGNPGNIIRGRRVEVFRPLGARPMAELDR